MPFEDLRRKLDLQKQAQDAELKHQQWLQEQKRLNNQLAEVRREECKRQAQENIDQINECFNSSHINELIDEFIKLLPQEKIKKTVQERDCLWMDLDLPTPGSKKKSILARLFKDSVPEELSIASIYYKSIQLTWGDGRGGRMPDNSGVYINSDIHIGFSEDKSLIVIGGLGGSSNIPERQWRGDPVLIENAIEKGYSHPNENVRIFEQGKGHF